MAETLVGYLHVIRTAKQLRGGLGSMLLQVAMENAGIIEVDEYPPTYWFHVPGRTVGLERAKVSDFRDWRNGELYMFRFKGQPKLLDREMDGYEVTVRGSYEPWLNGLGGHMKNYRVTGVTPTDVACPCRAEVEAERRCQEADGG